ncbi:Sec-independent protein translocase subunit TatA/TatB [Halegenticoccus tardaugens]|uniref:Sec-independent protein translocase subunit TatA/TatB n=1 Tax=Halegenticoccus tardaugens TaxID=2071624 RepID=UPI00100B9319|nr:twin-arginine translocase TatA/TatE family subunit [Halegenticoccus tardaugens]
MFDTVMPLFGPIPGGPELLIILLVLVLLFGANKIPKLARSTGQAMGEFQKGREEVEEELQQMRDDGERSVTGEGSTEDEDDSTPAATADETATTDETTTEEATERSGN